VLGDVDEDPTGSVAAEMPLSQGSAETGTPESSTETGTHAQPKQDIPPLEWVPIPLAPHSASSTSPTPQNDDTPITTTTTAASDDSNTSAAAPTPTNEPTGTEATDKVHLGPKLSRRERILHLARQNARTPLPDLAAKSQQSQPPPPPLTDEETERQGKERTIRERLWRLVGGNY